MPMTRKALRLSAVVLAFLASACGEIDGTSTTNGGIVPVSQSGTYAYTVTIAPLPSYGPSDCTGAILILTSGSTTNMLNATGSLYFAAGNWTGFLSLGDDATCEWTLTLTPS